MSYNDRIQGSKSIFSEHAAPIVHCDCGKRSLDKLALAISDRVLLFSHSPYDYQVSVFISYSHDSEDFVSSVRDLSDRLRSDGVPAEIDQYVDNPSEGWPKWMDRQVEAAVFVLVLCTKGYLAKLTGDVPPKTGHGIKWESLLTYQSIYESGSRNDKFVPVVTRRGEVDYVPKPLRAFTIYNLECDYEILLRRLIGLTVEKPEVGRGKSDVAESTGKSRSLVSKPQIPTEVELVIAEDISKFSPDAQKALLGAVQSFLDVDYEVKITKKRSGSTIVTLELEPNDAERLRCAVLDGVFLNLLVVDVTIVSRGEGRRESEQERGDLGVEHVDRAQEPQRSSHEGASSPDAYNRPGFLQNVAQYLQPRSGRLYLDCIIGRGCHAEPLLSVGAKVIGLDEDPKALSFVRERFDQHRDNFGAIEGGFRKFGEILETIGMKGVDGILLNLAALSKPEDPEPEFGLSDNRPLDLRRNPALGHSAADLVNTLDEDKIAKILHQYGEEERARQIAKEICLVRRESKIVSRRQLVEIVEWAGAHPVINTLRALRIAVNDELGSLEKALAQTPIWLRPGGRLVIITSSTLERNIVETFMHEYSREWLDPAESLFERRENPNFKFKIILRGLMALNEKIQANSMTRSVRLHVAERLPDQSGVIALP